MSDEVSIQLAGDGAQTILAGWQEVRITVGIERVPPDFEVTYTERAPGGATSVAVPGQACTLQIGSDTVLTGYVDVVDEEISAARHQLRLTGRGRTEDLVDCAAVWQGAMFRNVTALDMAQRLAAAYGIPAVSGTPTMARLPVIMMNIGETAYEVIDRVCKLSGLLAFEQPDGSLLLTRVGSLQAASGFQEGRNVQRAGYRRSMDQRFSNYTVVYPGNELLGDTGAAVLSTYSYQDTHVPRFRQKYVELLSNSMGVSLTEAQAKWERNRRWGRSHVVRLTADSWRDLGGTLWTPNTLAEVDAPSVKVSRSQLLIGEVTFVKSLETGTTAEIELMPPQAFDVEPIPYMPIPMDVEVAQGLGPKP